MGDVPRGGIGPSKVLRLDMVALSRAGSLFGSGAKTELLFYAFSEGRVVLTGLLPVPPKNSPHAVPLLIVAFDAEEITESTVNEVKNFVPSLLTNRPFEGVTSSLAETHETARKVWAAVGSRVCPVARSDSQSVSVHRCQALKHIGDVFLHPERWIQVTAPPLDLGN